MTRGWMTMGTVTYACPSDSTRSVAFLLTGFIGGNAALVKWGCRGRPDVALFTQMFAETV